MKRIAMILLTTAALLCLAAAPPAGDNDAIPLIPDRYKTASPVASRCSTPRTQPECVYFDPDPRMVSTPSTLSFPLDLVLRRHRALLSLACGVLPLTLVYRN